ncbi:hypothetical protein CR513_30185, partial [Mucuna pruriens]
MEEIRARAEKHYERRKSERKAERKEVKLAGKAREDRRPMLAKPHEQTQRFTPLNEKRAQIMHEICHTSLLEEARGKMMGKEKSSWCDFHRAFDHTTEDCWGLKTQIEKLVQNGHLDSYTQGRDSYRPAGAKQRERSISRQRTPVHRGTISTISGGRIASPWAGSNRVGVGVSDGRVQTILTGANTTHLGKRELTPIITFDDRDMRGRASCQDELMVISMGAVGYRVESVLID